MRGQSLKIQVDPVASLQVVVEDLKKMQKQFHSYATEKRIRVVIRALPENTPLKDIEDNLTIIGYHPIQVSNMYVRSDSKNVKIPLILVVVSKEDSDIYDAPRC